MDIFPLHGDILEYLKKHSLEKKFFKQLNFLLMDISYPSLEVELLEPKHLKFWSFRVDKKYRVIFKFLGRSKVVLIAIGPHNWIYKIKF